MLALLFFNVLWDGSHLFDLEDRTAFALNKFKVSERATERGEGTL